MGAPCQATIRSSAASLRAARSRRPAQQEALGQLAFAVPFVLAGERPDGIGRVLARCRTLRSGGRRSPRACLVDRGRMLAAQAEGFEEALAHRRDVDAELAHAVVDDGLADGRMLRRFVLDDLQRPDARALLAPRRSERGGRHGSARAGRRWPPTDRLAGRDTWRCGRRA